MKSPISRVLKGWTLVIFVVLAAQAVPAKSAKDKTPSHGCELYPIALSLSSVSGIETGTLLSNLRNGDDSGEFVWLTWNGNRSRRTLVNSLTAPGDSVNYINPKKGKKGDDDDGDEPADRELNVWDWVQGTEAENHKNVRQALDKLKKREFIVPLWDRVDRSTVRVAGFAKVELVSYELGKRSKLSVRYLGKVKCDPKGNQAPVVNAGPDQTIHYPERAILAGSVTDDGLPAGGTLTCSWSKVSGPGAVAFADPHGARSIASFSDPGVYVLRLHASDGAHSASDEVRIEVSDANEAPVANAQTLNSAEDAAVNLTLTATDPDGDVLSFTVASNPSFGTLSGTPPNLVYQPAPNVSGTDSFTFSASDGTVSSAVATITLNVAPVNDPPVAYGQSVSTDEDAALAVALAGNDVEGTALTFTILNPPTHGVLSGTPPNLLYTPAANHSGSDQLTFRVDDGALDSAPATVTLTIRPINDLPVALGDQVSVQEDGGGDVVLRGSDVESSVLTFSIVNHPVHGVLSGTPPNVRYAPTANYYGPDSFTFRVNDGTVDSAPATVSVAVDPVNDAPVALAGSVSLDEDAGVDLELRGNDVEGSVLVFTVVSGPSHGVLSGTPPNVRYTAAANYHGSDSFVFRVNDGALDSAPAVVSVTVDPVNDAPTALADSVSLAEDTGVDLVLRGNDVEGSPLTFTVASAPSHGVLSGTAPNVRYVPVLNYHGPDSFTFKVNDGSLDSALVTVSLTVTPVNDAPVAASQTATTAEDTAVTLTVTATDAEDDSLTFSVVNPPAHGTLSGPSSNPTYTPHANYNGPDSFQFRANDGTADSELATVTLTVTAVNDAPVAAAQSVVTPEDASVNVTLSGSDVEESTLTFTVTVEPAHGVLSGTAPDLVYMPNANFNGSDSFAFIVSDGALTSAAALVSLSVTPVNDPPVADSQALPAVEAESTTITLTGSDVDNDPLTYEIVAGPTNGTLTGSAPNLSYTPNITGRPEVDTFTFTVSDGVVTSPAATVAIDIIYNQPPVVSAGPDRALRSTAEVITLAGVATDDGLPRNSTLQLSWQMKFGAGAVTFGDAASATTTASFSASGLYILELSASDSQYTTRDLVEVRVDMICNANPGGVVAWWPANCVSTDIIGGNEAVFEGGTVYGAGRVGAAFTFDGVDDRVSIAPHASLDLGAGNAFTIEFWVNSTEVTRSARLLGWHSGVDVFSVDQGVNIFQSGGNLHAQIYDTNNVPHEMVAAGALVSNVWMHVAVTYDRSLSQGRIYVNGALRTTINLGNFRPRTTYPLFLGNILPDAAFFEGALDEITLYARALDPQEIHEIVAANGTGKCPVSGNLPPLVSAGPDVYLESPGVGPLNGSASDDGLPAPASLRAAWSVISGPGTVTFADSAALATTATFDTAGIYVLRLSVDDAAILRNDIVEVRVAAVCTIKNLPGLVAWFPGNGTGADVVGGREGRLAGGLGFVHGHVGGAFNFDGVNDSVRVIPADPGLDVGAGVGFSIEFWVNSADVARNARFVAYHTGLAPNGTNTGVNIFQLAGNLHVQIPDPAGASHEFVAAGAFTANTWTHVAVTYDRTRGLARAYLNGAQRTLANVGIYLPRTLGNVHLGNLPFDLNHFRGLLDEVSIYNRTLDAQEVYELFSAGSVGKCPNDPNQGPVVNAGSDLFLRDVAEVANLSGVVTDDGLPPGYSVRSLWSVVDGPGTVTFTDATLPVTTAAFSAAGIYILRLAANDALISTSDLVEVRVGSLCTVKDPAGLVAWWPANNSAAEVAGGRNGRLAGGVAFASGKVSSAFRFDGVNDVVQVPAHPSLDVGLGNGLSLEFWVNSTDVMRFARVVGWHFGMGTTATNFGVNVYQQSGTVSAQIYDTAGVPHEMGAANSLVSNIWTHVAVTYDRTSGQGRIFINGALRTTANLGVYTPRTSYNLFFGNLPSDAGFFRGMLDEVSLYSRPLDAQEVYEIYNAGTTGKCPRDNNQAPVVNAGPNLELASVSDVATLNGFVSDDNLPTGAGLRLNWSKLDGPGTVTFGDTTAPVTTVSFSAPGIYVLSLAADDAAIVRSDLVEVRVAVACAGAPTGLVAWWPGNGNAQELVGGRDGRLAGGTTFASGRVSAAFSFDGTNDSVQVPAHASLDVGQGVGLTVEFWVNPADVTRNARLVGWHSGLAASGTNFGVNVQMLGRVVSAQVYDVAGLPHDISLGNALTNNTWAHVAVTYDRAAGQGRIYLNGVLRATAALGSYTARTSYRLFLGNVPFDANHFRGFLDEVSIYDRALGSNEVAAVFAAGAAGKCPLGSPAPMFLAAQESSELLGSVTENEHGQRTAMTDASGTTTYTYDKQGRVTRITKAWSAHAGAPATETALTYEYDALGRFAGVHSSNANGVSMRYVWDDANRLVEVLDPHSGGTTYHYDAAGKPVSYVYPDGVTGSAFPVLPPVDDATVYDAASNPVRKTTGSLTTYYVVSPLTVTGAPQVVEELTCDPTNPLLATPTVTRVYVHGLHTISVEELVGGTWKLSFFD